MFFQVAPWVLALFFTSPAYQAPSPATTPQPFNGDRVFENEGFFEGDILLTEGPSEDRGVVTDDEELWPAGVIPYVIRPRSADGIKKILDVMKSIEAVSCLRFVNRTTQEDYVFIDHDGGCSSFVGRQGGEQRLSLHDRCLDRASVTHELLHAAGFYHEHNRSDRDEYIVVFPENVEEDMDFFFKKREPSENRLLTPFDMESVMLYGSRSFSRAPGLPTILTKDGKRLPEVEEKEGLSASDARRIRILYKCRKW